MPNYRANYPATVAEVLDDSMKFKPEVLRAVRKFARSKPWSGSLAERTEKYRTLHAELCAIYQKGTGLSIGNGGVACYFPRPDFINLPVLSVVTYLHEFGHALGKDERQTCRWSINLFRRCFPRSFARCRQQGHMLIVDRS